MQPPPPPMGCPPGLEYLTQIDQLLIRQQVELFELFTGCEMKNKYQITNSLGQQVYFAKEDTDCCTRQCCGPARPFEMEITDNTGREVIHLSRPLRCACFCCWCCLQTIEVQAPRGNVVGYVEQEFYICKPKFTIKDANRQTILTMTGPICACRCCADVEFPVLSADGTVPVGKVTKQWTGLIKEAFTDAENFGITFPMDLDVKMKAVMLGAVFLIDFMFFETQNHNN
ncbi:predicted protein [Nematostella vectensis]|uniref:Phospholipid scramblase n=2 Tax=Nematostella vectensis TaxID=45351 RepID=A7SXP9_NEMVE|nr:predicted protein [Nematostella vectensis]|eukprot:XP_001623612.1 predicted protein [Nematostella vectensis]